MNRTSTQNGQSMTTQSHPATGCRASGPRQETINLLRQFARAYFPANTPAAIVLN